MPARTIEVRIQGEDQAGAAFKSLQSHVAQTQGFLERFTSSLGSIPAKLATFGLAVQGLQSLGAVLKPLTGIIAAASDMNESVSKAQTVFGDSYDAIAKFAQNSAQSMGLSTQATTEMAGTFGNLFTSMGLGRKPAADLSMSVLTLGSDLASFNNIPVADALEKLRAGLVGETEPLRSMGVNITAAAVTARVLAMGLDTSTDAALAAAQVQARYALILEQTKNAQGDFARTSTGMANAQRIISASFQNLRMILGQELLPVIAPLISTFATALPAALIAARPMISGLGQALRTLVTGAVGAVTKLIGVVTALRTYLSAGNTRDVMREWFGNAGPIIDNVVRKIESLVGFFRLLATNARDTRGVLYGLASVLDTIYMAVSGAADAVFPFSDALKLIKVNATDARGPLYSIAGAIDTVFGLLTGTSGTSLGTPFASLLGFIKGIDFGPIIAGALRLYDAFKSFSILDNIIAFIKGFSTGGLEGGFKAVGTNVTDAFKTIEGTIGPVFTSILDFIGTQGPAVVAALQKWIPAFVAWAQALGMQAGTFLAPIITGVVTWIGSQVTALASAFTPWINAFFAWLPGAIGQLVEQLPGQFDQFLTALESGDLLPSLGTWTEQFLAWVVEVGPQVVVALPAILLAITLWVARMAGVLGEHIILHWIPAFVGWVVAKGVPLLTEALANLYEAMRAWVAGVAPQLLPLFDALAKGFVQWIVDLSPAIDLALITVFDSLVKWITDTAVSVGPSLVTLANTFVNWVTETVIPGLAIALAKVTSNLLAWIGATAKSIGTGAAAMGQQLVAGFVNGLAKLGKVVTEKLLAELRSINIDLGWIKISGGSISFNFPTIVGSGTSAPGAAPGVVPTPGEPTPTSSAESVGVPAISPIARMGALVVPQPMGVPGVTPINAPVFGAAAATGGTGAGITIIFQQPVYGMADFEDAVVGAVDTARRRGRAVWAVRVP